MAGRFDTGFIDFGGAAQAFMSSYNRQKQLKQKEDERAAKERRDKLQQLLGGFKLSAEVGGKIPESQEGIPQVTMDALNLRSQQVYDANKSKAAAAKQKVLSDKAQHGFTNGLALIKAGFRKKGIQLMNASQPSEDDGGIQLDYGQLSGGDDNVLVLLEKANKLNREGKVAEANEIMKNQIIRNPNLPHPRYHFLDQEEDLYF